MKLSILSVAFLCFLCLSISAQNLSESWEKPVPQFQSPSFCPPEGDGGDRELNLAKNRVDEPAFYHAVSLNAIKNLHYADAFAERDRDRLSDQQRAQIARYEGIPVRVTGYIKFGRNDSRPNPNFVGAEKMGPESCNCGSDQADQVDYHITLIKNRSDDFRDAIIAEMSPRVRAIHPTWNLANLRGYARKGYQVRVFGWLFFDGEHKELMFDPQRPDRDRIRRATLWEVHPITRFEVKIDGVWKIL